MQPWSMLCSASAGCNRGCPVAWMSMPEQQPAQPSCEPLRPAARAWLAPFSSGKTSLDP